MKYRYKNQKIDNVVFKAEKNKDGTYSVQMPHQDNILIYGKEDFEKIFEAVNVPVD